MQNFRENIAAGYLPLPTDVTYEGIVKDYYFDTTRWVAGWGWRVSGSWVGAGMWAGGWWGPEGPVAARVRAQPPACLPACPPARPPAHLCLHTPQCSNTTQPCTELFCPIYSLGASPDPLLSADGSASSNASQLYLAVGLDSGLQAADFKRKRLNLVVLLDVSGSMGSPFDRYYYDQLTGQQKNLTEAGEWRECAEVAPAAAGGLYCCARSPPALPSTAAACLWHAETANPSSSPQPPHPPPTPAASHSAAHRW